MTTLPGLKVILVFGTYPPMKDGGAGFIYNLGKELAKSGAQVYIITTSIVADEYRRGKDSNPRILPIVSKWDIGGLRSFSETVRQINPDIIHLVYPSSYFGNDYKLPFFIKLATRKPLVTTFFSFFKTGSTFFTKIGTLSLILFSQRLVSHDEEYVHFLKKFFPFKKAFLIPVGMNTSAVGVCNDKNTLRKNFGLDPGKIYFSYIGQMDISKGLETLLEALRIVIDRGFEEARLIMVGSGDAERMKEGQGYKPEMFSYGEKIFALGRKLGLNDHIVWTSYLPSQDYNNYIRCSDFCVLPFRRNTMGRSSLALALSLGMPVITANKSRNSALLRHEENVFLVRPGNKDELADAMVRLMRDAELRDKIAKGGKELSKEFSWGLIAKKTLELYSGLLKKQ